MGSLKVYCQQTLRDRQDLANTLSQSNDEQAILKGQIVLSKTKGACNE